MPVGSQVEGENPLGKDGKPGGESDAPDVKKYVPCLVISTNHLFIAPKDKYSDVASILGIKVDPSKAEKENAKRGSRGDNYIQVAVRTEAGATIRLNCDPTKVGDYKKLRSKKVYGQDIDWSYIPKTQPQR